MKIVNKLKQTTDFTLIELLVTIAIIAILASMLLPALHKARLAAQKIVCTSNMKTMGQGISIYTSNNDDYLTPHRTRWGWTFFVGDALKKLPKGFPSGEWESAIGSFASISNVPTDKSFYCPIAFSMGTIDGTTGGTKAASNYIPLNEMLSATTRDKYGWGYFISSDSYQKLIMPKKISRLVGNRVLMTDYPFKAFHVDYKMYSQEADAFSSERLNFTTQKNERLKFGMEHGGVLNNLRQDMSVFSVSAKREWVHSQYQYR